MNKQPKISIVIPCYNHGHYLEEAISSVELYQPKSDYEIIIVNDGSTEDATLEVLGKLEKAGYQVIHQENHGLSHARNTGFSHARAPFILPLDCDNRINPAYIGESLRILTKDEKVGVVYGQRQLFGELDQKYIPGPFRIRQLLTQNYIDACAVIRKSAWKVVGGYDESMGLGYEDWEFWIRLYKEGFDFYYIPKVLFHYRVEQGSMVHNTKRIENHSKVVQYIQQKHIDLVSREYEKLYVEWFNIKHSLYKPIQIWFNTILKRLLKFR